MTKRVKIKNWRHNNRTKEDLEKGIFLKGEKIDGKYPNYQAVTPREFNSIHKFDCYKLLQYCCYLYLLS